MENVVILSAVRTAVGSFGGSLKDTDAVTLGKIVMEAAVERAKISPNTVNEVIFGCVLQAGLGQNVSRQCAINAGLPDSVPALTLNKVCGSGLRAISLAAQTIMTGDNEIVIAGGTENMSRAPYALEQARYGYRMGDGNMKDTMVYDGLWDVFNDYHMGITAENVAALHQISREEQDNFAVKSQNKAENAQKAGRFKDEIIPVELVGRRGEVSTFDQDEYIKYDSSLEKVSKLRPAFKEDGTVTAANASGINDGAAALVLMSEKEAENQGLQAMAKIVSYASSGIDPAIMGLGPVNAIAKALDKANLTIEDIDLFELNEAFAAQAIGVLKSLKIDENKVNVNGGAIAIGHPIGASGTRILVTLLHEMDKRNVKYGLAALCVGGGMGTAIIVENMGI